MLRIEKEGRDESCNPQSLVLKEHFLSVLMRLVGLISAKTIEYFFARRLCKIWFISWKDHPTCTDPMNKPCMKNVAKCNLGKVKIKPMLVAGCVCGVSG